MIALFFITLMGLGLRLIGIVKPDGLWNDEYVAWQIASTSFSDGFVQAMLAQCHMPLYYLYLKMCMAIGGSGDTFLRLTSLVPGVLSIIVMYFVGLQDSKKTALYASILAAISSFLIYYSQEVRLYSLLFLFSALALLYLLKYLKEKSLTNILGLLIFNFAIMFTHTIGFVFVFFELLILSILIFKETKKQVLYFWGGGVLLFLILLPNIYHILTAKAFSQWWGTFSISKIGFLFTDYFSPIITNLVNAPEKFIYNSGIAFIFFLLVPAIVAIVFICKALYRNKINLALFIIAIMTVISMIVAALLGKLVFITKYSIEIYPILIFLAAFGAANFKIKYVGGVLMSIFCVINLWYLVFSPVSAPKIPRPEGHKIVADLINGAEPQNNDVILLQYYGEDRFGKYFDFANYEIVSVNKGNFPEYLSQDGTYKQAYDNGKETYKPIFKNSGLGYFEYKLQKDVLDGLKTGQNVIVIINDNVSLYNNEGMTKITSDDYVYSKIPLMFMIFSYTANHTIDYLSEKLAMTRVEKKGAWSLVKFTKLKK